MLENWLIYDGRAPDEWTVTKVDTSWYDMELQWAQRPYCLRLSFSFKNGKSMQNLTGFGRYRVEKFRKNAVALAEDLSYICVGERHADKQILLFFYGRHQERGAELLEKTQHAAFEVASEITYDPSWRTYCDDIYPNPIQLQSANDKMMIDRLVKSGDDPRVARRLNHHIAFPNELKRIDFECDARAVGFAIGDPYFSPERPLAYGSTVHNRAILDYEGIQRTTAQLVSIATRHEGCYEYWDCPIQRKRR